MCGILGIINFDTNSKINNPSPRFILNRGPDGINMYSFENVVFCHSRLAVVNEEETSSQPINNEDFVLVCNGEIYNYEEIGKKYNFPYSSTSDSEAIIHVYKLFGIEGLNYLDGTFSFALIDKKNRKIILHRDNVGKKPLYFLEDKNYFIFASNITAIADNYNQRLAINQKQVEFYMENGFISPLESIFEEIKPILPGEVLEIDLLTKKTKKVFFNKECFKYTNFDFQNDELIEREIEKLLFEAVYKRIKNVKTPVLLFSAGIDSTTLASMMCEINKNTKLVSLKQPIGFLYDEPYIRYASRILRRKIIFVDIINRNFYKNLDNFIKNLDQPLSLYHCYYLISALVLKAREFGKVLFTGSGGDELCLEHLEYRRTGDWFLKERQETDKLDLLLGPAWDSSYSNSLINTLNYIVAGFGFVQADKAISENQMEPRCPFWDWNLLNFVRKIPVTYWEKNNINKYPMKKLLLKKGFSERFVYRNKVSFRYPFKYLMMLKYPYLAFYLNEDLSRIDTLGLKIKKVSMVNLYMNFDLYWRAFIFLKYFENNKSILKVIC